MEIEGTVQFWYEPKPPKNYAEEFINKTLNLPVERLSLRRVHYTNT